MISVSVSVRRSFVQGETPGAMRSRVAAVDTVFIGASHELREFESGSLAVVLGGMATAGVAMPWNRPFPALRLRDSPLVQA